MSDRSLNRLIVAAVVTLAIGIPAVAVLYTLDRAVGAGPSLIEREIAAAEEVVRQEPNRLSVRLALAAGYMAGGRTADAVAQYSEILRADPGYKPALMGRGDAHLRLANLAAAAADFQAVVDAARGTDLETSDPQVEAALYRLGSIALQEDRAEDAVPLLEEALGINRADADAWYLLGTAYLRTDRPADAVGALRRAVAFVPAGWCDPYVTLVHAYSAMGHSDGIRYANGMVAFCQGRFEEADRTLQAVVASPTVGVDALLGLGLVAETRGAREAAAAWYEQVVDADPSNFVAIAGLNRLAGVVPSAVGDDAPVSTAPQEGDGS